MVTDSDLDYFHDVVAELLYVKNIKDTSWLDKEKLLEMYNALPLHIKNDSTTWGFADTVFRDNAYTWLLEKWEQLS